MARAAEVHQPADLGRTARDGDRRQHHGDGLRARRRADRPAGRGAATGRGARAGAAAERREHGGSRDRGREGGEVRTALADRGLEVAARLALAQVGADAPAAQAAPVRGGDRLPDRRARHVAPLSHPMQRRSGLVDGLLGGGLRDPEGGADLGERDPVELAHDQRAALALRELVQVAHQPLQALAGLRPLGDATADVDLLGVQLHGRAPGPQDPDGLVVGDPEQPRLQGDLAPLARQGAQRLDHRRLQRVLGLVGVAEDRPAVAVELAVVAAEDRVERAPVPARRAPGKPAVVAHRRRGHAQIDVVHAHPLGRRGHRRELLIPVINDPHPSKVRTCPGA